MWGGGVKEGGAECKTVLPERVVSVCPTHGVSTDRIFRPSSRSITYSTIGHCYRRAGRRGETRIALGVIVGLRRNHGESSKRRWKCVGGLSTITVIGCDPETLSGDRPRPVGRLCRVFSTICFVSITPTLASHLLYAPHSVHDHYDESAKLVWPLSVLFVKINNLDPERDRPVYIIIEITTGSGGATFVPSFRTGLETRNRYMLLEIILQCDRILGLMEKFYVNILGLRGWIS
ncbi:hypothetical protein J6590_046454 [Homalodisca vitripennis]|nr:hypothetical protein J6590_046454 [Homalodisca vitripennis]